MSRTTVSQSAITARSVLLIPLVVLVLLVSACSSTQPSTTTQTPTPTTNPGPSGTPIPNPNPTPTTGDPSVTPPSPSPNGITATQLAQHASSSDCWVVYEGNVYDLTSFLPRHPGGVGAISRYCGTASFESAFLRKHGQRNIGLFMQVATPEGAYAG